MVQTQRRAPAHSMRNTLPVILPPLSFEEQVRFLWGASIGSSSRPSARVLVSAIGSGDFRDLIQDDLTTHAFRRVPDFIGLAAFSQWLVPFPTFMRLACLHLHLDRVKANCNSRLLKNPEHQNVLYWTFWLNAQGIDHQRHFI